MISICYKLLKIISDQAVFESADSGIGTKYAIMTNWKKLIFSGMLETAMDSGSMA